MPVNPLRENGRPSQVEGDGRRGGEVELIVLGFADWLARQPNNPA
jgi:hypothetical protein